MNKIRILLVDDHKIYLESMSLLLESIQEISLVGTAVNGYEAIKILESEEIDIVLTDISMPIMNGNELIFYIRQNLQSIKVIALTMSENIEVIKNAISAGVASFLNKAIDKAELVKAIRIVYEGQKYFSNDLILELAKTNNLTKIELNKINLTDREIEVMNLILKGEQSPSIAEKLFISFNTVETHRKNIYKKLNINSSIGLFQYAIKNSLIN